MWTFSDAKPLPTNDLARRYNSLDSLGNPDTHLFNEIRPHAISPDGKYIGGTCSFNDASPSRTFVFKNRHQTPGMFDWSLEPDLVIPKGWGAVSIRGINDNGDVAGFHRENNVNKPFVKLSQQSMASDVNLPTPNATSEGEIFDIDNNLNIVGYFKQNGNKVGFKALLKSSGTIDFSQFDSLGPKIPNSFNQGRELLYSQLSKEFVDLEKYPSPTASVTTIDLSAQFAWLLPAQANLNALGLNREGEVVGFYNVTATEERRGILCLVGQTGVSEQLVWVHPNAAISPRIDTRLFSISDKGIVVGTYDRKNPFYFLTGHAPDPPPHPWATNRLERLLEAVKKRHWPPPFPPPSPYYDINARVNIEIALEILDMVQWVDDKAIRAALEDILYQHLLAEVKNLKRRGEV